MKPDDFDHVIDAAAREMVDRTPGRSLGRTVMRRVREEPASNRQRFVWVAAAASVVLLCGILAVVGLRRTPAPARPDVSAARSVVLAPSSAPAEIIPAPAPAAPHVAGPSGGGSRPVINHLVTNDSLAIEFIETAPIVVGEIELPPIENQPASVARIEIEELTIPPLTVSND